MQKFFGVMPLYLGVEIILGISIFNKAGGAYGFLSIFTGHPINFFQWLWNILCILILPFYISSLLNLAKVKMARNVRKMSLCTVVFLMDTAIGVFYTFYFIIFWFHNEENSTSSTGGDAYSNQRSGQSATQTRELFFIFSTTIVVSALRFYFVLVVVSFTKQLLKYSGERDDEEEQFEEKNKVQRVIYEWEIKAKNALLAFFR